MCFELNPDLGKSINYDAFEPMVKAAKSSQIKRFIYASTIYIHSAQGGFYRISKQASELYIEEYSKC